MENDDDELRRISEVRWFLRYSQERAGNGIAYLELVAKHRGQPAADALRKEAAEQWSRGNRGKRGEWK